MQVPYREEHVPIGWEAGADCSPPSNSEMEILTTQLSNREVNLAGEALMRWRSNDDDDINFDEVFNKVAEFRATHAYPLRVVTTILRQRTLELDPSASVYARTKRMVSIIAKLMRNRSMKVTTMQDLGGCRAVVNDIVAANELARQFREIQPRLDDPREDDYIARPKIDGYRSIHFVVKYKPKCKAYSHVPSRRIEIQIRSLLQHQWATALETTDLFTHQSLKVGGGNPSWKQFFVLTSSLFAAREGCPTVPGSPSNRDDLLKEIRSLWLHLNIADRLNTWATAVETVSPKQAPAANAMYLIETDIERKTTMVKTFPPESVVEAFAEYSKAELRNQHTPSVTAVLVSAWSLYELRDAFPSYYGDTKAFINDIEKELGGG